MLRYALHRLMLIPVTMLGITFLVFSLSRFLPGGPLDRFLWSEMHQSPMGGEDRKVSAELARLSPEQALALRSHFGLDEPLLSGYGRWLGRVMRFDLGQSLRYQEPVAALIAARFPVSLLFGGSSLIFSYAFCVPLGLWLSYRPQLLVSRVLGALVLVGSALPSYVFATLLFLYGAAQLRWFPLGGLHSEDFASLGRFAQIKDIVRHAALPLLAYLAGHAAVLTFSMRHQLDEQLGSECMRQARAKGASQLHALLHHALPLSLLPLITQFAAHLSLLFAGSFVIERVFNIDGMGLLAYEALVERDYPLVLGILTLVSFLHLLGNLLADLLLAWADPRVSWDQSR